MANVKTVNTPFDVICSIYTNGDMLEMQRIDSVAPSKRKDAIAVMMGLVLDATNEYENVTASISVSLFRKSLLFDGSVWRYM